ncbi:hypothetical protein [Paenibacillus solani]|uniref:hypothetical protein n=1 Tax=Paenibacillus solani TaxID=1705565 RepID=UPI003D2AC839
MESTDVFLNFRPIYILFIMILIISLLILMIQKNRQLLINGFTIGVVTSSSVAVSAYLTYQIGILSDELGIGGDAVSFYMFIAIVMLSLVNLLVYLFKK